MLITLLTDFGEGSHYVAQMKGVILGIHPGAQLVDVSHAVAPQSIGQAARLLGNVIDAFPKDTCHVVVVDPGVGTKRNVLLARVHDQFFIAPDNGVLTEVMTRQHPDWVRVLDRPRYWREPVSLTFHGRDIMAPAAAHLGQGCTPSDLGSQVDNWVTCPICQPVISTNRIEATIVEIDAFGNLITNVSGDLLPTDTQSIRVSLDRSSSIDFVATYADGEAEIPVALIGSGGDLEIAIVNGNATRQLNAKMGDSVVIRW